LAFEPRFRGNLNATLGNTTAMVIEPPMAVSNEVLHNALTDVVSSYTLESNKGQKSRPNAYVHRM
jgi:hypothetical protein